MAPFEADTNIASGQGNVSYEVHDVSIRSGQLSRVSRFIRKHQNQKTFAGTWMLVVKWSNIPQSGQASNKVSYWASDVSTKSDIYP